MNVHEQHSTLHMSDSTAMPICNSLSLSLPNTFNLISWIFELKQDSIMIVSILDIIHMTYTPVFHIFKKSISRGSIFHITSRWNIEQDILWTRCLSGNKYYTNLNIKIGRFFCIFKDESSV